MYPFHASPDPIDLSPTPTPLCYLPKIQSSYVPLLQHIWNSQSEEPAIKHLHMKRQMAQMGLNAGPGKGQEESIDRKERSTI